jgi:hypothetical protein
MLQHINSSMLETVEGSWRVSSKVRLDFERHYNVTHAAHNWDITGQECHCFHFMRQLQHLYHCVHSSIHCIPSLSLELPPANHTM